MRQTVVLLIVFAAAFGAAFLLFRGGGSAPGPDFSGRKLPEDRALPNDKGGGITPRGGGNSGTAPVGTDRKPAGEGFPEEARKDLGVVSGVFSYPDGFKLSSINARLTPSSGALWKSDFEGFVFIDVQPGVYHIDLDVAGVVPTTVPYLQVVAGEIARLKVVLEPGVPIEGIVVEGMTQSPIEGATVFLGNQQLKTSATGRFKASTLLSPTVLEHITVTHPDFDRLTTRPGLVQDTRDVRLSMARGDGHVIGRFVLGEGSAAKPPSVAIVRLVRVVEALTELRRELVVRDVADFEIKGVVPDRYRMSVEFPGSGLPIRYVDIDLTTEPIQAVDIPLARGARLVGGIFRNGAAFGPAELELIDAKGLPYGEKTTAADGKFVFEGVLPGRYAVRFKSRIPLLQTDPFDVADDLARTLELDFDLGRVALK